MPDVPSGESEVGALTPRRSSVRAAVQSPVAARPRHPPSPDGPHGTLHTPHTDLQAQSCPSAQPKAKFCLRECACCLSGDILSDSRLLHCLRWREMA